MMPMTFCASLPPWPSEYSAAETNCRTRNELSTEKGGNRRNAHEIASTSMGARTKPVRGESTIAATVLPRPDQTIEPMPAFSEIFVNVDLSQFNDHIGRIKHS